MELVTCSGYSKNGGLSILQQSVRPLILSSFDLPACRNGWALVCSQREEPGLEDGQAMHRFLIVSKDKSTLVRASRFH
jgi:cleavage and polyadenylation specificity factor subunit 1